jgi:hypothetical protein
MSFLSGIPGVLKVALPLAVGAALAGAIAWGASGGAGGGGAGAPEGPAAAAPTPKPEKTPGPPWDSGRPDCPPGWTVYNDPDGYFSVCFPPSLTPLTYDTPGSNLGVILTLAEPDDMAKAVPINVFAMTVAWSSSTGLGVGPPSPATCSVYTGSIAKATSTQFIRRTFGTKEGTGCLTRGIPAAGGTGAQQLRLFIPRSVDGGDKEGFVKILLDYVGPDFEGTFHRAEQILDTLRTH